MHSTQQQAKNTQKKKKKKNVRTEKFVADFASGLFDRRNCCVPGLHECFFNLFNYMCAIVSTTTIAERPFEFRGFLIFFRNGKFVKQLLLLQLVSSISSIWNYISRLSSFIQCEYLHNYKNTFVFMIINMRNKFNMVKTYDVDVCY